MAYGVQTLNSLSGHVKTMHGEINRYNVLSGSTAQCDLSFSTDFTMATFSATTPASGGVFIGINGNGGSYTINNSADQTAIGVNKGIGVLRMATGTTSNSTGYAAVATGPILTGIPTPASGFVTKYEMEIMLETEGTLFTTAVPGQIEAGFRTDTLNTDPTDGVYFQWNQPSAGGDTTWFIVFRNTTEERVNTAVTVAANKLYQMYLSVERNSAGTFTTSWRIKNLTDNTDTSGTAAPSNTSFYPSGTSDQMRVGAVIHKQTTTTTTSRYIILDYIHARIQVPLERSFLISG